MSVTVAIFGVIQVLSVVIADFKGAKKQQTFGEKA